ncbi:MAG: ABC transporter permease [Chitinophagaceae bacterium]|nr:ABC transporter permease [Chitinophagaceae bacterium]
MFRNYLKVALRNILRHKAFSMINIAGLAIGMTCSIFILLWVQNELSFDRFHANADKTYRIVAEASGFKAAVNCAAMPAELKAKFAEVKNTVRLSVPQTAIMEMGDKKFDEKRLFYADSTFLQVFSFPLVKGDRKTALTRPDAILITEKMALKYFGKEDPIGKILRKDVQYPLIVTGVLKNIPSNSHLQFDFIQPMSAIANVNWDLKNNVWDNFNYYTYIVIDKPLDKAGIAAMNKKIDALYKTHVDPKSISIAFDVQPLADIHLRSYNMQVDLPGHGNIQYVNIFFIVAIFILVVACINYMNLATARSARRAKEVGLRKVVGAGRKQLIGQFLGESLMISLFSLVVALAAVWLLLPTFNYLAGKEITFNLLQGKWLGGIIAIALITGLLSGSYPALFLSNFQPVRVLKSNRSTISGNKLFRNGLVVLQFVVSIILLAGTVVIYRQLKFIREMNLGFDKSNLVYFQMKGKMWQDPKVMKNELRKNPLTADFTIMDELPINLTSGTVDVKWPGKDPNSQVVFPIMHVSDEFFDVMNMTILNGRSFSDDFPADTNNYVINEKAARVMGYNKPEEAVGKPLKLWDRDGMVIGVVKDFNFKPVQQPIEPMILDKLRWGGTVVVRAPAGRTEATIAALQKVHNTFAAELPFSYDFLDQNIANLYQGEQRMGALFNVFAVIGIFISCMGLYGLSAFMAEQRTKEIGVRKVLGASVFNMVYMLSTGFTKLIMVAVVIAVPVAWWAVNAWLDGFAFRIEVNWVIFVLAAVAALLIAWITVSYESVKAALANPVKSLRNE